MPASLERARLLFSHERYDQAERESRAHLAENPNEPEGHILLALCLCELERFGEATEEAQAAIHLAPDHPMPHYALAKVMLARDRYDDAAKAIRESIRLDPYDADYHGMLAATRFNQRNWQHALAAAEAGLEIDAEHTGCLNLRAASLVQLGRRGEAGESLAASLQKNPHNADTHANQGWTLLHAGRPKEAMEHFREALRLDPESDWAKSGILEAIKARNVVYRWILAYFLWMGRLSSGAQWAVIIGAYFAQKFVRQALRAQPELGPILWPLLGVYYAFALMTWLAYPLFNLMLRLHPLGKHALSPEQRMGANVVGVCLGLGLIFGIVGAITWWYWALIAAGTLAGLALPAAGAFSCQPGYPRNVMVAITLALAVLGLTAAAVSLHSEDTALGLAAVYFLGLMASTWISNALASQQPTR